MAVEYARGNGRNTLAQLHEKYGDVVRIGEYAFRSFWGTGTEKLQAQMNCPSETPTLWVLFYRTNHYLKAPVSTL